jgi:hypothetical protein
LILKISPENLWIEQFAAARAVFSVRVQFSSLPAFRSASPKAKGCAVRSLVCLTLYFYYSGLGGINLQRLFREFSLWFVWVAGFSTVLGA